MSRFSTITLEEIDDSTSKWIKPNPFYATVTTHGVDCAYGADKEFHTNQVNKAFYLLRLSLTVFGRWPFSLKLAYKSKDNPLRDNSVHLIGNDLKRKFDGRKGPDSPAEQNHDNGEQQWSYQVYSSKLRDSPLQWIYFLVTTTFLSAVLILSVLGFCDFFLDWHLFSPSRWDGEETKNFENNLVPFVLVWSCLMHSTISSVSMLLNRRKLVKFLNYWNVAVDSMNIQVPKSIKTYILANHLGFGAFLIVIYIAYKIM
jgi:hypothetical protein